MDWWFILLGITAVVLWGYVVIKGGAPTIFTYLDPGIIEWWKWKKKKKK